MNEKFFSDLDCRMKAEMDRKNVDEHFHCFSIDIGRKWVELSAMLFPHVPSTHSPILIAHTLPERAWPLWRNFKADVNQSLRMMFQAAADYCGVRGDGKRHYPWLPMGLDRRSLRDMRDPYAVVNGRVLRSLESTTKMSLDSLQDIGTALNSGGLPRTYEEFAEFLEGRRESLQRANHVFGPLRVIGRTHGGPDYTSDIEERDFGSRPRSPGKRPHTDIHANEETDGASEKIRRRTPIDSVLIN